MGRPKATAPRFKIGDRVAWVSPSQKLGLESSQKRTGTVVSVGKTREEALSRIPQEYGVHYKSERVAKGPFYYVAADTPLFKPGFSVHCVPARRLQKEADTIEYKIEAIRGMGTSELRTVVSTVAIELHKMKKAVPKSLLSALAQWDKIFPQP